MEPPHWIFESTHTLFDSDGDPIPPLAPEPSSSTRDVQFDPPDEVAQEVIRSVKGEEQLEQDTLLDTGVSVLSTYSADPSLIHSKYGDAHSVYTLHSVLMSDDIVKNHESLLGDLPERYSRGSVKAKVTWFGALCMAGVGMFVEVRMKQECYCFSIKGLKSHANYL
jgi:hypothetical protein